jgi:hypothetical protein
MIPEVADGRLANTLERRKARVGCVDHERTDRIVSRSKSGSEDRRIEKCRFQNTRCLSFLAC